MEDASGGRTRLTRLRRSGRGSSILINCAGWTASTRCWNGSQEDSCQEGTGGRRRLHPQPAAAGVGALVIVHGGQGALLLRGLQYCGADAFDDVGKHLLPAKTRELLVFRVATTRQGANDISRFRGGG